MSALAFADGALPSLPSLPPVEPDAFVVDPDALALVDAATARRLDVLPMGFDARRDVLSVATPAAADVLRRESLRASLAALGRETRLAWRVAEPAFVAAGLARLERHARAATRDGTGHASGAAPEELPDDLMLPVDALLHAATATGASDLHLTPGPRHTRVRHRIDGALVDLASWPAARHAALAVRLKVMAGLDIAECRLPQDGAFRRVVRGRVVDFRLSSFPSVDGESLVVRVLDAEVRPATLDELGLTPPMVRAFGELLESPGGLTVVAGPTGSGKSTTLHALLRELAARGLAVATLEDPVEHRVEGVCQCSIDPARGLDHAAGVRALLRQDPDVLMIGEIRDGPSCRMALRAAAAGHRVLATVHAVDAAGALERLVELGATAAPASGEGDVRATGDTDRVRAALARTLAGVAAQRLLGRPCEACAGTGAMPRPRDPSLSEACPECRGRGLAGRFALVELLRAGPAVREALRRGAPLADLVGPAARDGFVPLATVARAAVAAGFTTRSEVRRTLGDVWTGEGAR